MDRSHQRGIRPTLCDYYVDSGRPWETRKGTGNWGKLGENMTITGRHCFPMGSPGICRTNKVERSAKDSTLLSLTPSRQPLSLSLTWASYAGTSIGKRHTWSSPISHTTPWQVHTQPLTFYTEMRFSISEDYPANITVFAVRLNVLRKPTFPSIRQSKQLFLVGTLCLFLMSYLPRS